MNTRVIAGCVLLLTVLAFCVLWYFLDVGERSVARPVETVEYASSPTADSASPAIQERAQQKAPVRTIPSGTVEGKVLTRYGAAAVNAEITLARLLLRDSEKEAASTTVVDATGAFALHGLAMGSYAVTAETAEGSAFAQATLAVEKPTDFVRMILGNSGTIQGTIVDSTGLPVADAAVETTHHNGDPVTSIALRALGSTRTNTEGEFLLGPLPASNWQLYAYKIGAGIARTDDIEVGSYDLRIELVAGHRLSGQLVDLTTGYPVADTVVQVRAKGLSFEKRTVASDGTGHFEVSGLVDGPHVVSLEDAAWSVSQGFQEIVVPVSNMQTVIQCVRTSAIEGHVIESTTGAAVEGVVVTLYPRSAEHPPRATTPTGTAGQFSLAGLAPLTYVAYIGHPGDRAPMAGTRVDTIHLKPGENRRLALRVSNTTRIEGTVTDTEGNSVSGAVLEYDVVRGRNRGGRLSTGDNGQFAITRLSQGDLVTLVASNLTSRSEPIEVRVPRGETEHVELVLSERLDGSIGGKVVDVRGAPLMMRVHATRRLDSAAMTEHWRVDSAADGVFLLAGLPAGTYDIGLGESSGWNRTEDNLKAVQLLPGQELLGMRLVYDTAQMNSIRGHVVDTEGRSVADATVSIRNGIFPPSIPTDEQGAFQLVWLEPEVHYPLFVWHPSYEFLDRVSATPGDLDVTLEVRPKPIVAGNVVSSANGLPIARFSISGGRERHTWTYIEHPEGEFKFAVFSGEEELLVRAEGFLEARVNLPPLASGQRAEGFQVRLKPGTARITGRVIGVEGPVGQACIEIGQRRPFSRQTDCAAVTDATGEFEMSMPSDEPEWITISHPGYAVESFIAIPSDSAQEFTLNEGGSVLIRSQRGGEDGGHPIAVRALDQDVHYHDFLGPDGTSTLDHILPGVYSIAMSVESEPTQDQSAIFEVQNGLTTEVDF